MSEISKRESNNIKHGLIITAYKNYKQLYTIVKLYSKYFYCYIHIDKKSKFTDEEISSLCQIENCICVNKYKIMWGSYKHIMAILELINIAIKNSNLEYLHLISGEDFIIQRPVDFNEFFNQNKGKNFIEMQSLENYSDYKKRYDHYYFMHILNYRSKHVLMRLLTHGLTYVQKILKIKRKTKYQYKYKGLIWCSITLEAANYILSELTDGKFINELKYCAVPEEFFFQNILAKSPYNETIVNDSLRYCIWDQKQRGIPAVLNVEDYKDIIASGKMFARKVNINNSKGLFEKLIFELNL